MQFKVEKKQKPLRIDPEDMKLARIFAKKVYDEMGSLVQALILFGSVTRKHITKTNDIDILIVIDDVHIRLTPDVIETYRIIISKIIADTDPKRLHIQSMKLSSFWEYVRAGDPVAINILRDGIALIDTGFFDPLQALLDNGRIRPSREAIWNYFTLSYASESRAKQHLLTAIVDCYWAAIDSAHAALMSIGEVPSTPSHVADILEEKMVKKGLIEKRYADIMRQLYLTSKSILNRDKKDYTGVDYDKYKKLSQQFVNRMKTFIEKRK